MDLINRFRQFLSNISWPGVLYFFGTTLLICAPAFYNRYPLVYFDTGSYLYQAFDLHPDFDRPIGYGLFIRVLSMKMTTWTVIIGQSLILNYLIFRTLKVLIDSRKSYAIHLTIVAFLMLFSSMSWYAAQLMPDIFTSALLLAVFLLIGIKDLKWPEGIFLLALIGLFTICHYSHSAISILLIVLLAIGIWRKFPALRTTERPLLKVGGLVATVVAGMLFLSSYNYKAGLGFKYSLSSNVFLTANLCEMGLLQIYLDENCENSELSLCKYKDHLPKETGGFLWAHNGPFQGEGLNWTQANEEYAQVVNDFITRPRYLAMFVKESGKATFKQLFQVNIGSGLYSFKDPSSPPYSPIEKHLPQELNEYLESVQSKGVWNFRIFNLINYLILVLSIITLAWAAALRLISQKFGLFLLVVFSGVFFNAFVTASLANVYERLQARVTWLIVFAALIALVFIIKELKKKATTYFSSPT